MTAAAPGCTISSPGGAQGIQVGRQDGVTRAVDRDRARGDERADRVAAQAGQAAGERAVVVAVVPLGLRGSEARRIEVERGSYRPLKWGLRFSAKAR